MAEGGDHTEDSPTREDTVCAAAGDGHRNLMFREVRQSGSVALNYQTVDITSRIEDSTNTTGRLRFHHVHTEAIKLSADKTRAKRTPESFSGLCFSHRPVKVNEKVYIKTLSVLPHFMGTLRFGFTTLDPKFLMDSELLASRGFSMSQGISMVSLKEEFAAEGRVLCYWFTENGQMFGNVDDQGNQFLSSDMAPGVTAWAVLDLFGISSAVELTNGEVHKSSEELVTLSWPGFHNNKSKFSKCSVRDDDTNKGVSVMLLDNLCEDNFRVLRQLAALLFRDHRTKVMSVRQNPVSFYLEHQTLPDFNYLQENLSLLAMNLKNLLCEENAKLGLNLDIQIIDVDVNDDGYKATTSHGDSVSAGIRSCTTFERETVQPSDHGHEACKTEKEDAPLPELQNLEEILIKQRDRVHVTYLRKKKHFEEMLTIVQGLLDPNQCLEQRLCADTTCDIEKNVCVAGDGADYNQSTDVSLQRKPVGLLDVKSSSESFKNQGVSPRNDFLAVHMVNDDCPKQTFQQCDPNTSEKTNMSENNYDRRNLAESKRNKSMIKESQKSTSRVCKAGTPDGNFPRASARSRATGLDTFLCFDTSGDTFLGGLGSQEMKEIALEFIDGLQTVSTRYDIDENIGIVAFDRGVWMKYAPTCDYDDVRECVLGLQLDSKSSLVECMKTAQELSEEKGNLFEPSGIVRLFPRMIVLTNYNLTNTSAHRSVDGQLMDVLSRIRGSNPGGLGISWIPTRFADGTYFNTRARLFHESYIVPRDIGRLVRFQCVEVTVCKILKFMRTEWMHGSVDVDVEFPIEMFSSHLDKDDQDTIRRRVRHLIRMLHGDKRTKSSDHTDPPSLGSRVIRGQDWMWDNQDGDGPGTVTAHGKGYVSVEWDAGNTGQYRFGHEEAFDVEVVKDRPRMNISDYVIEVGREVERGPDWGEELGNKDGGVGGVGVVISSSEDGTVQISWGQNGNITTHKCGLDNKVELTFRDPNRILKELQTSRGQSIGPALSNTISSRNNTTLTLSDESNLPLSDNNSMSKVFKVKSHDGSSDLGHGLNLLDKHTPKTLKPTGGLPHSYAKSGKPRNGTVDSSEVTVLQTPDFLQHTDQEEHHPSFRKEATVVVKSPKGEGKNCTSRLDQKVSEEDIFRVNVASSSENVSSSVKVGVPNEEMSSLNLMLPSWSHKLSTWQWLEQGVRWLDYSRENVIKLEQNYTQRPGGTCLLTKDGISYRVLFKAMEERCIDSNVRNKVRRIDGR